MPQLPLISGQKLIKILGKIGYQEVRQRGSHVRLVCPNRNPITVPDYRLIDRSLARKIIRDAELSVEEFIKLVGK